MKVLVTGGAGFIGSHIVDSLLERGDTVLAVDDLSSGSRRNLTKAVELRELDVTSPTFVTTVCRFRAEAIVHCAAQSSVVISMKETARDAHVNIIGGINVCAAAKAAGCAQVVYINTGGALYGEPLFLPMSEDHPIKPTSGYGLSKWTCEQYLDLLLHDVIPVKTLRLANIYGPRQDPYGEAGVVAIFGAKMVKGEPVTIFGDGEQTRDFVYVGDVARAVALALDHPSGFSVNIASQSGTSVNALFQMLAAEADYGLPPVYGPPRPGDVKHSVLTNELAGRVLGWSPATPMDDGLRRTLAWIRESAPE
jgi:UDP-glucose 4-epimerase